MSDPKNVDDAPKPAPERGDELLRRMLKTPPKPHKGKDDEPKPAVSRSGQKKDKDR